MFWYYCEKKIGHFWVPPGVCFKTRVGAQPLIWKSFVILMQMNSFVHLASFWKWGFLEPRKLVFLGTWRVNAGKCIMSEVWRRILRRVTLGVPNTAILGEKLVNTETLCRKSTKYRYRVHDHQALWPRQHLAQPQPLRENIRRPRLTGSKIEKHGLCKQQQLNCTLTAKNCLNHVPCSLCFVLRIVSTCIGHERANERYRSTTKDLLLPNRVSRKDEKANTAGLDDTAIPHEKI